MSALLRALSCLLPSRPCRVLTAEQAFLADLDELDQIARRAGLC